MAPFSSLILILIFHLSVDSALSAEIPVLGGDGKSEVILGTISKEVYVDTLVATKAAIDDRIANGLSVFPDGGGWKLDRFSIGLGLTGEIGVGPYKFGTALKQRLMYGR
jgi:hypothetical protein